MPKIFEGKTIVRFREKLEKIIKPISSKLQGETIKIRLYILLDFLNKRYGVNYTLQGETQCGASASFEGSPACSPPVPPRGITFNWTGKYSTSIKEAVWTFLHEYAHILLVELGWRNCEQYCDQFADITLKEIEVACPEFLHGDVDVAKEAFEQFPIED